MNFLNSCLLSLVLLLKSSVTITLAFFNTFANLNTVSRSLNVSKVTKTGRQPRTSGPVRTRVARSTGKSRLMFKLSRKIVETRERKLSVVSGCLVVIPYKIRLFFLLCSNSYIFSWNKKENNQITIHNYNQLTQLGSTSILKMCSTKNKETK